MRFKRKLRFSILAVYVPSLLVVMVSWLSLWVRIYNERLTINYKKVTMSFILVSKCIARSKGNWSYFVHIFHLPVLR